MSVDNTIGRKGQMLQILSESGYRVPPFIIFPSTVVKKLHEHIPDNFTRDIEKKCSAKKFAVRSCALIEDSDTSSHAGQFMTKIDVSPADLSSALKEVLAQAHHRLKGDLSQFSVLIQEYIPADFSGVTFTRDPSGGREMVMEYHRGIGEELVSGRVNPKQIVIPWTLAAPKLKAFPEFEKWMDQFKNIERHFGHPQDIEWCVHKGKLYFLQTRPITTIHKTEYRGMKYLDEVLPKQEPFFYAQTEISEIAPRPSPITFALLQKIYAASGPIEQVYAKHNIKYQAQDFLKIIGNQLYVDREAELHTLLPSYTYLSSRHPLEPSRARWKEDARTSHNKKALQKMKVPAPQAMAHQLAECRERCDLTPTDSETALKAFLTDYQLIFEVNVLAQRAAQRAESALRSQKISLMQILSSPLRKQFYVTKAPKNIPPLLGNALEIADETPFAIHQITNKNVKDDAASLWWKKLSSWRQTFFQPFLERAVAYDALREQGRWLTAYHVNALRHALKKVPKAHAAFDPFTFPAELTNLSRIKSQKISGLSSGTAEGILVTVAELARVKNPPILYTPILSPDLFQHFDKIKGIVSVHGGLLSHLAILAREHHLPVVSGVNLKKMGLKLGDRVHMSGENGTIIKSSV